MGRGSRGEAALVGVAAGAATLGVAEVLAGLLARVGGTEGTPSPLLAVADTFVDLTPAWLRDAAIAAFGTADKTALFVGMGIVLTALCAGIGLLARRRRTTALITLALVGAVGAAAALTRPEAQLIDALPTVLGVVCGLVVLRVLTRPDTTTAQPALPGQLTRRSVLVWSGSLAVLGVLGVLAGRALSGAGEVVRAAPVPNGASGWHAVEVEVA